MLTDPPFWSRLRSIRALCHPRKGPSSRHPQSVGPVSGFHVHRLPGDPPRAAVLTPAMSGCGRPPAHPSSCPRHRPARAQEQGSSAAQTPAPSCPKTGTPHRAGQSLLTANSSVQPLPPTSFVRAVASIPSRGAFAFKPGLGYQRDHPRRTGRAAGDDRSFQTCRAGPAVHPLFLHRESSASRGYQATQEDKGQR